MDQALVKDQGIIELRVVRKEEVAPDYYILGSISQVDTKTVDDQITANIGNRDGAISALNKERTRFGLIHGASIVTVDLHLVRYPSREVIPGGSVANSMVVRSNALSGFGTGLIEMTGVDLTLKMNRVESLGQAVRNLVELGAIELLGRHARVPYWSCLSLPTEHPRRLENRELAQLGLEVSEISRVQAGLVTLGYLNQPITHRLDKKTRLAISRFQADEGLIASGVVDFDLTERLAFRLGHHPTQNIRKAATAKAPRKPAAAAAAPKRAPTPATAPAQAAPRQPACAPRDPACATSGYRSLVDFLK